MITKKNGLLIWLASSLAISLTVQASPLQTQLNALEVKHQGKLGLYAINTANQQVISHSANHPFPLCSTNKVMGVAAILHRHQQNNKLNTVIHYHASDVNGVGWAPVTKQHIDTGMTVAALSKAAIAMSDNAAINLLMKTLGGPQQVTAFARQIGDKQFTLTRWEPALNQQPESGLRDTTTPKAMAESLQKLLLGNVLLPASKQLLTEWMIANQTGNQRIRRSVPTGWIVGDKTGTCSDYGTTNDIGIVWPKGRPPIIISAYFMSHERSASAKDAAIAEASAIVIKQLTQKEQQVVSKLQIIKDYHTRLWDKKDITAIDEFFAEDVTIHSPLKTTQGTHELKAVIQSWYTGFPNLKVTWDDFIVEDNKVVAMWHAEGKNEGEFLNKAPSNKTIHYPGVSIYQLDNNKVSQYWAFVNMDYVKSQL